MDVANKDEAQRCLEMAKAALAARNADKAERLARKALRLFPTDEVRKFLAAVERAKAGGDAPTSSGDGGQQQQQQQQANGHAHGRGHHSGGSSGSGPGAHRPAGMGASGSGLHQRQRGANGGSRAHARDAAAPDEDHMATPEQRELVARIRSKTCYYEVGAGRLGAPAACCQRAAVTGCNGHGAGRWQLLQRQGPLSPPASAKRWQPCSPATPLPPPPDQILGVAKGANDDDIKKAYRKLALKLHPDKASAGWGR